MAKAGKEKYLKESEVKLKLGDWFREMGFLVYDEKQNKERQDWGVFKVRNIQRGKRPDLVICGNLKAAKKVRHKSYVAIEIKRGYKHKDILDGFDDTLGYFGDYLWGAEYLIDSKLVEISAFVFSTLFSREGFLFSEEGKFNPRGIVKGPWDAYPMTFTISRLLWRQKDNILKRFQTLSGIPKVEKKMKGKIKPERRVPEIGVLVRNPKIERGVLLMLSENPYHWKLEAC